jgi:hypothetical protein
MWRQYGFCGAVSNWRSAQAGPGKLSCVAHARSRADLTASCFMALVIPDLPTPALSAKHQLILKDAIQYGPSQDPAGIASDMANPGLTIHKELHRRYWANKETFPNDVGTPIDVGIDRFACSGKIIIFREYLRMLKVIKAQYGVTRGLIMVGNPGIGVYASR